MRAPNARHCSIRCPRCGFHALRGCLLLPLRRRACCPGRTWVCASTRMVQQCFFSCSSSASICFLPSVYFLTYLVNAFFLDFM